MNSGGLQRNFGGSFTDGLGAEDDEASLAAAGLDPASRHAHTAAVQPLDRFLSLESADLGSGGMSSLSVDLAISSAEGPDAELNANSAGVSLAEPAVFGGATQSQVRGVAHGPGTRIRRSSFQTSPRGGGPVQQQLSLAQMQMQMQLMEGNEPMSTLVHRIRSDDSLGSQAIGTISRIVSDISLRSNGSGEFADPGDNGSSQHNRGSHLPKLPGHKPGHGREGRHLFSDDDIADTDSNEDFDSDDDWYGKGSQPQPSSGNPGGSRSNTHPGGISVDFDEIETVTTSNLASVHIGGAGSGSGGGGFSASDEFDGGMEELTSHLIARFLSAGSVASEGSVGGLPHIHHAGSDSSIDDFPSGSPHVGSSVALAEDIELPSPPTPLRHRGHVHLSPMEDVLGGNLSDDAGIDDEARVQEVIRQQQIFLQRQQQQFIEQMQKKIGRKLSPQELQRTTAAVQFFNSSASPNGGGSGGVAGYGSSAAHRAHAQAQARARARNPARSDSQDLDRKKRLCLGEEGIASRHSGRVRQVSLVLSPGSVGLDDPEDEAATAVDTAAECSNVEPRAAANQPAAPAAQSHVRTRLTNNRKGELQRAFRAAVWLLRFHYGNGPGDSPVKGIVQTAATFGLSIRTLRRNLKISLGTWRSKQGEPHPNPESVGVVFHGTRPAPPGTVRAYGQLPAGYKPQDEEPMALADFHADRTRGLKLWLVRPVAIISDGVAKILSKDTADVKAGKEPRFPKDASIKLRGLEREAREWAKAQANATSEDSQTFQALEREVRAVAPSLEKQVNVLLARHGVDNLVPFDWDTWEQGGAGGVGGALPFGSNMAASTHGSR